MAEDVEGFIAQHGLEKPTLIGHSMGAKVAMALALRNPHTISALISVDNSPIDAALKSDFGKYLQGMRVIEEAKVSKQSDADVLLQNGLKGAEVSNSYQDSRELSGSYGRFPIPRS